LSDPVFEWSDEKASSNFRKHKVSFDEASTVFDDPNAFGQYDHEHSTHEDRWRVIGMSSKGRLVSVIYTQRHEAIRIISARRANKAEKGRYPG
jgi:uncharacterized DUF497 family protein